MTLRLSRPAATVLFATLVFACAYVVLGFNRLHALRVGSNTGSYLQAALHFLQNGSTFNYGDWHPELTIHDQWMMLVLAPFAWIYPHPETVIVVQVLALASAAPLVYVLARAWNASPWSAAIVAIVVLITPSMQGFAYNEFVPLDFVPALAFALAIAVTRRSMLWTLALTTALCGTKEDVGIFVAWLALWYAIFRDRRMGYAVFATAAAQVVLFFLFERIAGASTLHPSYGMTDPFWRQNLAFTLEMLAPFAFAPLALGWRVLLAAPLAVELFLAQGWSFPLGQAGNYYTIPFVTAVALAAVAVLAKHPRWTRLALACSIVMALFFNTTVVHFGRHPFPPDPQYPIARAWGASHQMVEFPCEDQGAWVVAASDPNAKLLGCTAAGAGTRTRGAWSDEPLNSAAAWTRGPRS
jgi:uncharacterized membrane protein